MVYPTIKRLREFFSLIEPVEFENCLQKWISTICDLVFGDIINIDGKTLRGSSHINGEKKASHIVNAYCAKHEACLGSVKTPDKSNEIKGIPILVKALKLKGLIITIDAMGTQKGIANLIREKQGHYVLALKKNHKRFYRKVDNLFKSAEQRNYGAMVAKHKSTHQYDHSRIEEREYTALPMMYLPAYKKFGVTYKPSYV